MSVMTGFSPAGRDPQSSFPTPLNCLEFRFHETLHIRLSRAESVFLVFRLGPGGGKDDAAGSQPISERQNGNRPNRLRGLDMPRDFPHGAMLDGRRKDTKDLSFILFPYRSRVALLWLAFVLRRWHPGVAFPMQVQNWNSSRGRKESGRTLRSVSVRAQSHCNSPAMPSHVVVWAPALAAEPEGPTTLFGSRQSFPSAP